MKTTASSALVLCATVCMAASAAAPTPVGALADQVVGSTDPADFEAYLEVFPNGVFQRLAENRLAGLRSPGGNASPSAGRPAGGAGSPPRALGYPALVPAASPRRVVLATCSGADRSVRRWWFWPAAVWRWAATR